MPILLERKKLGMFDELSIPNDLSLVSAKINEYYN